MRSNVLEACNHNANFLWDTKEFHERFGSKWTSTIWKYTIYHTAPAGHALTYDDDFFSCPFELWAMTTTIETTRVPCSKDFSCCPMLTPGARTDGSVYSTYLDKGMKYRLRVKEGRAGLKRRLWTAGFTNHLIHLGRTGNIQFK